MKRRYEITVEIDTETIEEAESKIKMLLIGRKIVDIKNVKEVRTSQQRKATWLWCDLSAKALNEKNFDMREIIREDVEIAWSKDSFMEYIFRPLMKVKFNKKSTNKLLKTGEIDDLVDIIIKLIAERTNGEVQIPPFPSWENM